MELTKPSGLVSQYVCMPPPPPWCQHLSLCGVDTVLCLGISVLSTYSYHPFIATTIYPKILSNLWCYMELLNLSGFIRNKMLGRWERSVLLSSRVEVSAVLGQKTKQTQREMRRNESWESLKNWNLQCIGHSVTLIHLEQSVSISRCWGSHFNGTI